MLDRAQDLLYRWSILGAHTPHGDGCRHPDGSACECGLVDLIKETMDFLPMEELICTPEEIERHG